jgi:predicted TIM-barrel fold metal-dependent hydrolase
MPVTYRIISADAHIEVPPDQWARRVPAKFRDLAPKRIRLPNGGDGFLVEGGIYQGGMNLWAGKSPEEFNPIGLKWDEMAGTGSAQERLQEQDADGIDAEVLYPGVGGVRGITRRIRDNDAYNAMVRAYNGWLAEDYCSADPDRLIGVGCIPERGLEDALNELEYCAKVGLKTVELAAFPSGKAYSTPEDDRFWAAVVEMEMPLTVHIAFARQPGRGDPVFRYPIEPPSHLHPADYVRRLARYGIRGGLNAIQMVMAGVFDRFPKLRVYWAENQIGWVPIYLEQMDHNYSRHRYWAERIFGLKPLDRLPSEYIREHMYWGFFDDPVGLKLRHEVGVDRILWAGDFPHVESDWPHSRAVLAKRFAAARVPEDEQYKIVAGNAIEFFHLNGKGARG